MKDDGILIIEQDLVRVDKLPAGVRVYGVPGHPAGRRTRQAHGDQHRHGRILRAVTNVLKPEAIRQAVADSVPPAFRELNLKAFDKGFEYGTNHLSAEVEKEEQPIEVSTLEQ